MIESVIVELGREPHEMGANGFSFDHYHATAASCRREADPNLLFR